MKIAEVIVTYINIAKLVLINELEKDHSMIETHLLKRIKCCDFYPNNFKFCAVKKNDREW